MRKYVTKCKERMLAFILAFVMIVTMLPAQAIAATPTHPDVYTICVVDKAGIPVEGAMVSYMIDQNKTMTATTDAEGVCELQVAEGDMVSYSVEKTGYMKFEEPEKEVVDPAANEDVTLQTATYKVMSSQNEGGSITLNGDANPEITVEHGNSVQAVIQANEGYQIKAVSVDGKSETITDKNQMTVSKENVTADVMVAVEFVRVYTVSITVNGDGGAVTTTPACEGGQLVIEQGENVSVSANANETYQITEFKVDNKAETLEKNATTFTKEFKNVEKDYQIFVTFAKQTRDITVTKTGEGTIQYLGKPVTDVCSVEYGSTPQLTIIPAEGYEISEILVDGQELEGEPGADEKSVIVNLQAMTTDTALKVTFIKIKSEQVNPNTLKTNHYEIQFRNAQGVIQPIRTYVKNGVDTYVLPNDGKVVINPSGECTKLKTFFNDKKLQEKLNGPIEFTKSVSIDKIKAYRGKWGGRFLKEYAMKMKFVIDQTLPEVQLLSSKNEPLTEGPYNQDIPVKIKVEDVDAGIQSVKYKLVVDNVEPPQDTVIHEVQNGEFVSNLEPEIRVPVTANANEIKLIVTVTDRAGNTNVKEQLLKIDQTAPVVEVAFDAVAPNKEVAGKGYYQNARTATITVTEKNFDENKVEFKITQKDAEEKAISERKWSVGQWTLSGVDTHTAQVTFSGDVNYTFDVSVTDQAGNKNTSVAYGTSKTPTKFAVDTTAPDDVKIQLEQTDHWWNKLLQTITFGIWKNVDVTVTATAKDATTPIEKIEYYKTDATTAMTKEQLDATYQANQFQSTMPPFQNDERVVVYARVENYAGQYCYVGTNGIIIDKTKSGIQVKPKVPASGVFNEDDLIQVEIGVTEPETVPGKGNYSGIQSIQYWIVCDGEVVPGSKKTVFEYMEKNPTFEQLQKEWTDTITIPAKIVEEMDDKAEVSIVVETRDNAGNTETKVTPMQVDRKKPEITVAFDNNTTVHAPKEVDGVERGYFNQKRKATITVKERAENFDGVEAKKGIVITAKDAKGTPIPDAYIISENWTTKQGAKPNDTTHSIAVEFVKDANYTFEVSYTDKAGNANEKVDYSYSKTPNHFTVDTKTSLQESPEHVQIKAKATGWEKVWKTLLTVLTFGIWRQDAVTVSATAEDATSPIHSIEYYKTDEIMPLDASELAKRYANGQFTKKEYKVQQDERFVVYARVEDEAGNVCWVNTDGVIVDGTAAEITLIPELPDVANHISNPYQPLDDVYGYYNNDVTISVGVEDAAPYSGIKSVSYKILCDGKVTKEESLFAFTKTNPKHEELVNKPQLNDIVVDAKVNNSCDVEVVVTVEDNAGNISTKACKLDIDCTKPVIDVTYDNNNVNKIHEGRGYFHAERTATVILTERTHHFDAEKAREEIKITAVDVNGTPITDATYEVGNWTTKEAATKDAATHTLEIKYPAGANYTFDISYTDEAGNKNDGVNYGSSVAPKTFTVDALAPTGEIKAEAGDWKDVHTWKELLKEEEYFFGLWSQKGISISQKSEDSTSLMEPVRFYKTSKTQVLKVEDLNRIQSWQKFEDFTVQPNEQFTVYLKMEDFAGNVSYICTNGMIVDNVSPKEETIAPEITVSPMQPVNGIYNTDVDVDVTVVDPVTGNTTSGLNNVRYEVWNMGEMTQSGDLYTFDEQKPTHDKLQNKWTGSVRIDKKLNNSNDVVLRIYASDNAKNMSMDKVEVKIDITDPQIAIRYDNNQADSQKYYKENRIATVVVTERNFDEKDVEFKLESQHGNRPMISGWTKTPGTGNGDDTTYTARISYTVDDDYKFDVNYKDLAGNVCPGETYAAGTTNPTEFTIDKTVPTMNVSYDNTSAQNGNYYKADRTATVRIVEHNFDPARVQIRIQATDNGSAATVPSVSGWRTNGDVHEATIHYGADALYTFDLAFTDMAGNQAAPYATEKFYVDKTKPAVEISKIVDQSANTGKNDIGFVLTAKDTNFDVFKPVLKAVVRSGNGFVTEQIKLGSISDIANGKVFTVKNLDVDGMYYLTCSVVDKAGNAFEEITLYDANGKAYKEKRSEKDTLVSFSVNREGSAYNVDSFTGDLNNSYVQDVYGNIIFVETNADQLVKKVVTVNGKALKEGKDYKVIETSGKGTWNQYQYVIDKDYFEEEGEYLIVVSSEDKAGSKAFSDVKGLAMKFTIDKTAPVVTVSGLSKNGRYQTKEQKVTLIPTDDGGKLKSVWCEILDRDGNVIKEAINLSGEALEKALLENNGKLSFTIGEGMYQKVRIICKDCSVDENGNTNTYEHIYTNVTVSSNIFKIFWANTSLRNIVLALLIIAISGFFFFIFWKRKKEEEEEEQTANTTNAGK